MINVAECNTLISMAYNVSNEMINLAARIGDAGVGFINDCSTNVLNCQSKLNNLNTITPNFNSLSNNLTSLSMAVSNSQLTNASQISNNILNIVRSLSPILSAYQMLINQVTQFCNTGQGIICSNIGTTLTEMYIQINMLYTSLNMQREYIVGGCTT